jgi:ABC-2 type transport system permease protein
MKNIFSFKLYLQGLRKVRTAGVAMAIVITVSNALFPVLNMISSGRDLGEFDRAPEIDSILFAPFGWLVILFAPLLVYNMFSYLNERKSSDFFHALPQKRICIYISFMFAVFTWIVGVLVLTTIVNMLLWVTLTIYVLNATAVVMTFLGFLILGLAMAGFMALAMMLTGTATANWLVFLLFFLFVPVCGEFFLSRFQTMVPMFNSDCSWLRIFEVEFFLPLSFR